MSLTPRVSSNFQQETFQFITNAEGFEPRVYGDLVGVPTIGYGYALAVNNGQGVWSLKSTLTADLGALSLALTATQTSTLNNIVSALNAGNTAQAQTMSNALGDQVGTGDIRLITLTEARTLFNLELDRALQAVRGRFRSFLGNATGDALFTSLQNSKEMVALASMAYNGPKLIGNKLATALRNDDRAEVWYEIRYNSNAGASTSPGIANRRYKESDQFGLYENAAFSETEAKSIYRMFTRHKEVILGTDGEPGGVRGYEDRYPPTATNAGSQRIDFQLAFAHSLLNNDYAVTQGISVAWNHIQVGEDTSSLYYKKTTADLLTGTPNNDLILGESGNDTITGEAGQDVIHGGTGNDSLLGGADTDRLFGNEGQDYLTGGLADDTLEGGPGRDLYWHDVGDGNDTIIDSDNTGTLVLGGRPLSGGFRDGTSGDWLSPDGLIRYALSGTSLTITYQGETLTLNSNTGLNPAILQGLTLSLIDRLPFNPATANTTPQSGTITQYNDADGGMAPDGTPLRTIRGTPGNDHFRSLAGDDIIYGGDGLDRLEGGPGTDTLIGDTGDDQLYGDVYLPLTTVLANPSNATATNLKGDWLTGGRGHDIVIGTNNNDALFGGGDADTLVGGAGDDDLNGDDNYIVSNGNWLNAGLNALPVNRVAGSTISYASYTITVTDSATLVGGPDQL